MIFLFRWCSAVSGLSPRGPKAFNSVTYSRPYAELRKASLQSELFGQVREIDPMAGCGPCGIAQVERGIG